MDLFDADDGHVLVEFAGPGRGLELELRLERHGGVLVWFWIWSQDGALLAYGRAGSG